ncbi:MAG: hypothetical protein JNM17_16465 [Archangium sp.]|nr:hypothetical protein [Archangium sp.]
MFSTTTRVLLISSLAACVVASHFFRKRQNRGNTRGGKISNPKLLWLFFAIWFWLFECAVLAFEPSLPEAFRLIVGVHALSFWIRGGVEMVMLHVTKNWRPPLGIAHDLFCIATVLVLATHVTETGAWGWWAYGLVVALIFALVVETLYAYLFFGAVKGKTTGDDGIWFASEDEERFRRINRITAACNTPQVLFQLGLLGFGFGLIN